MRAYSSIMWDYKLRYISNKWNLIIARWCPWVSQHRNLSYLFLSLYTFWMLTNWSVVHCLYFANRQEVGNTSINFVVPLDYGVLELKRKSKYRENVLSLASVFSGVGEWHIKEGLKVLRKVWELSVSLSRE